LHNEFAQKEENVFISCLAWHGSEGGAQVKVMAQNLRIRGDMEKHVCNLDPNLAYYNPKS
jgi:hypothetical protein